MEHAITIGDVLKWSAIVAGSFVGIWIVGYIILVVLNPFSSGH